MHHLVQLTYLVATVLFVFSLHGMNDPKSATWRPSRFHCDAAGHRCNVGQ